VIKERKETGRIKASMNDGCGRNCDVIRDIFFKKIKRQEELQK
jgi:hypothetical protein